MVVLHVEQTKILFHVLYTIPEYNLLFRCSTNYCDLWFRFNKKICLHMNLQTCYCYANKTNLFYLQNFQIQRVRFILCFYGKFAICFRNFRILLICNLNSLDHKTKKVLLYLVYILVDIYLGV